MTQKAVLAYDLGGTKIAVGVVDSKGRVLAEKRTPAKFSQGKAAVLEQLSTLGQGFIRDYPSIIKVGLASAGPLDPENGTLLDPTNFAHGGTRWGKVPIAEILGKKLKRSVILENDAAAAILAEAWIGAARHTQNSMVLTLGTGLGTGIIANGELVRSGQGLHPEAGHMIIRHGDRSAPCGCGNLGCAEALLSGNGFGRRFAKLAKDPSLDAKQAADLARRGNRLALKAFEEYAELMAVAIHNYVRIFSPEIVVLTGSFANASDLFLPQTKRHLKTYFKYSKASLQLLPKITVSRLQNQAGLLGGAWVALHA